MDGNKSGKLKKSAIITGIAYLAIQHGIYLLGHELALLVGLTPFLPKIPFIDDAIPIVSIFIVPYIWSYLFWAMGPMVVSKCDREHYHDFLAAAALSLLAGMLVLVFVPTYMDRVKEGLMTVSGTGVFDRIRRFWYSLDGSEIAYNLMPSFHCINSTMCWLGVCGRKELPGWFRIYSFVTMILIFLSTLFVKQHYFADVISGIAIAVLAFAVCKRFHWGRAVSRIVRAFHREKHEGASAGIR